MSANPLTVTKLFTTLSVVFAAIFTFAFGDLQTTKVTTNINTTNIAVMRQDVDNVKDNVADLQVKYNTLVKQLSILDSKLEDKTDDILKAIKEIK